MRRAFLTPFATRQSLIAGFVSAGNSVLKGLFASRPAPTKAGEVYLPTDGYSLQRDTGAAYESWGPIFPLTKPPAVASWTWINQGGASASDSADTVILTAPTSAGESIRMLKKAAPSTPYTITIAYLINFLASGSASTSYPSAGLILRQNATTEVIIAGTGIDSASNLNIRHRILKFDNSTTFNAAYVNNTLFSGFLHWMRLADNGTNRTFSLSVDGVNWTAIETHGRTDFLTADEVGVGISANGTVGDVTMTLLSWKES